MQASNRLGLRSSGMILSILMVTIFACGSSEPSETKKEIPMSGGSDAELAMIMRKIHDDAKAIRLQLKDSLDIGDEMPDYLWEMIGAETTEPGVQGPVFSAFANTYLNNMDSLYKPGNSKKELFNSVVNSCIDCHGEFCPGPIETIEKLKFKNIAG